IAPTDRGAPCPRRRAYTCRPPVNVPCENAGDGHSLKTTPARARPPRFRRAEAGAIADECLAVAGAHAMTRPHAHHLRHHLPHRRGGPPLTGPGAAHYVGG